MTDHIIPESDKLVLSRGELRIRQVRWLLLEKYPNYCASVIGSPKPLVHFLSYQVKEKIVQNMKTRNPTYVGTVGDLMHCPDREIEDLLGKAIVPKTYVEYCTIFLKEVDNLLGLKFEFRVRGYHRYLHARVDKMLDQIELYDDLIRRNADVHELALMPKMKWGKNHDPQAFNVFLHCFEPYKENFLTMLTDEWIRSCKSTTEFCAYFRLKNNKTSQSSLRSETSEAGVQPHEKIELLAERLKRDEMVRKLKDGAATPRSEYQMSKPRVSQISFEDGSHEAPRKQPWEDDTDEEEPSELHAFQRVPPAEVSQQRAYPQQHQPRQNTSKDPVYAAKPTPRLCMEKILTGKCPKEASCVYSHNEAACRDFVQQRLKMYTASPYSARVPRGSLIDEVRAVEKGQDSDDDSS